VRLSTTATTIALLATGCAAHTASPGDLHVQYDCGGFRFSAHYGREFANITLPDGRAFHLRQAPAASGTRYTDGTNTLLEQGGAARLELADAVHTQCAPL
jgi:membrane-bound inhibitor of C-type lysozyme